MGRVHVAEHPAASIRHARAIRRLALEKLEGLHDGQLATHAPFNVYFGGWRPRFRRHHPTAGHLVPDSSARSVTCRPTSVASSRVPGSWAPIG